MKATTQSTINGFKQSAIEKQDYALAAEIRKLEKNENGLPEEEIDRVLIKLMQEFNEKYSPDTPNRIGETMTIDSDLMISVNEMIGISIKCSDSADVLLMRAYDSRKAAFDAIRKKYVDFCGECDFYFNEKTGIITICRQ